MERIIFRFIFFLFFLSCQTLDPVDPAKDFFQGTAQMSQKGKKVEHPIEVYVDSTMPRLRMDVLGGFGQVVLVFLWEQEQGFTLLLPTEKKYVKNSTALTSSSKELKWILNHLPIFYQAMLNQTPEGWDCTTRPLIQKINRFSKVSDVVPKQKQMVPEKCRFKQTNIVWKQTFSQFSSIQFTLQSKNEGQVVLNVKRKKMKKSSDDIFDINIPKSFTEVKKLESFL